MFNKLFLGLFVVMALVVPLSCYADGSVTAFRSTELPLPRFVSLRSDKVYARSGPSLRYPIKWVYQREDLPVEITQEYDTWRKIRDHQGYEGWIHQSLLTGERSVLIQDTDLVPMREGFTQNDRLAARLESGVIGHLQKCTPKWCKIEAGGYRGWVERKFLWGIYETEELN